MAKFEGDRPRKLGGLALKKRKERKKETAIKHNTAGNYRSGGPNKL